MKPFWKPVAMALAVGAFACACTAPVGAQLSDERALSDVQRIYKNAALVVMGECMQSHINSDGDTCYDLFVEEVIAGSAEPGEVIHCTQGAMKDGETYLLYLAEGEDAYHTEDMRRYELLSDEPLFFLVNSYTTGLSPSAMGYILNKTIVKNRGGKVVSDEIGLPVTQSGGVLPCGSSSRWTAQ